MLRLQRTHRLAFKSWPHNSKPAVTQDTTSRRNRAKSVDKNTLTSNGHAIATARELFREMDFRSHSMRQRANKETRPSSVTFVLRSSNWLRVPLPCAGCLVCRAWRAISTTRLCDPPATTPAARPTNTGVLPTGLRGGRGEPGEGPRGSRDAGAGAGPCARVRPSARPGDAQTPGPQAEAAPPQALLRASGGRALHRPHPAAPLVDASRARGGRGRAGT